MRQFIRAGLLALVAAFWATSSRAGEVSVVKVEANRSADGTWRFDVTLHHADEGWDHYANLWRIETPDGKILAERVLAHPHVNEQPFTRSLSGVRIPDTLDQVVVRARDSVHGFGLRVIFPLPE
ncbi:hypothetical protein [Roseibium aggregatum]|uniref:Uncharacterized protein n=1 Tax=Roseibium aggregatum TaxID=187304 RepID=A0A926P393_9HYPH|nr:hypothetical protein [Roseibium aggregatum]MBD1546371.1 hypothetical protein [Roseibium aggregatum]